MKPGQIITILIIALLILWAILIWRHPPLGYSYLPLQEPVKEVSMKRASARLKFHGEWIAECNGMECKFERDGKECEL